MNALIQRFSLNRLVLILAGIPIIVSLTLAVELIFQYQATLSQAKKDQAATELILLYDNLAHNLAVERGLSAGVLGSKGNPNQVEALTKHRVSVDQHIQNLLGFQTDELPEQWQQQLLSSIQTELKRLPAARQGIDRLAPDFSPFAYYSNLNQLAIDNAALASGKLSNAKVAGLSKSLISVMEMKERAGQVRGALNGAFSRKSSSLGQYIAIQDYLASGVYAQRRADIALPSNLATELNQVMQNAIWKDVEAIQQQFLAQKDNLKALQGPEPTRWFAMATERIKLINGIRNTVKDQMLYTSIEQADRAALNMSVLLAASIAISFVLIVGVITSIRVLRKQVISVTGDLSTMSSQRDLSIELNAQGNNELSHISQSVNGLTSSIKRLLLNILEANEHSNERLTHIVQGAGDLGESSKATNDKCSNIATAMTQLSQSSLEIASSSERALEETEQMTNKVLSCQEQSQNSYHVVEALVSQIEQTQECMARLEQDAQSVSKIVDTINGISEQTNLLALNAAIEAARAGEHGRGFAVVSSEVRDLAQRSKEATEHISQLLSNITSNTQTAVSNMNKSREATDSTFESVSGVNDSISELEHLIETVNQHITSIANSTTEQSKASEDVDKDVDVLADIALKTGQLASNMDSIVSHYKAEVAEVNQQLQEFKLA
ncbi:methyl-accepting chemotaxis protein [Vibrio sinaloensis DSM 21326]|uniref:Methyl-accepting chemotaxis protein n=1 Tax=Vibrio sinaloensis DSM 21326 TaxID=945550 RepID=E8M8H0_PHOS4|nr:methyl-accepting chemotaxis protein [Vibrio sinaloensis]EGA69697.1 methyl-accepting chemotaxis protein [Vibrio sinaloensis DSM 21326]